MKVYCKGITQCNHDLLWYTSIWNIDIEHGIQSDEKMIEQTIEYIYQEK